MFAIVVVSFVILGGAVLLIRRPAKKTVRRFSDETLDGIKGRAPMTDPCEFCNKPRCPNKNNPDAHWDVKHENKAVDFQSEAALRGRRKRNG